MHHDQRFGGFALNLSDPIRSQFAAPSDGRWDSASRDSSIPAGVSPNPIPCRKGLSLRFFWCGLICFDRWYGIMRLIWKWYLDIIQRRNGLEPGIGDFDFASRMERAEPVQRLDLSRLSLRPRTYDQRLNNKNRIYIPETNWRYTYFKHGEITCKGWVPSGNLRYSGKSAAANSYCVYRHKIVNNWMIFSCHIIDVRRVLRINLLSSGES